MEKTNFKKLVSLSLAAMLCASVPAISANSAFATDGEPAGGGEPVPVEDNSFVVEETAAIRVSDPAGMRFYANIGADLVDDVQSADEFGFLIFPHAYLAEDENAGKADWQVKGIDGNAEYGLWDYVKVSTTEMDGLIYQRETDGKYCVNGVLHTVVDETMEFAAIAYYVKDGEPVYADFNEDFSRSLSYVAKWAYISEPAKRSAIKSTFDWLNTDEFTINSGKEMQMLSNAVSEDNPCDGLSFTLAKTIAVDGSTFTPVPAEFAGEWNWNGRAILVIADEDPNTDDERAFVSDTYNKKAMFSWIDHRNGVAVMSSKFIDGETARFWNGSSYVKNSVDSVANHESITETESLTDYVEYTGKAGYIPLTLTGSNIYSNIYFSVGTNNWAVPNGHNSTIVAREASELEAVKELYSQVKFRFYVSYDETGKMYGSGNGGITQTMGYINKKMPYGEGYWFEWTITIDQLIDLCENRNANAGTKGGNVAIEDLQVEDNATSVFNGAYLLPIGRITLNLGSTERVGESMNFYVGDCVFVK